MHLNVEESLFFVELTMLLELVNGQQAGLHIDRDWNIKMFKDQGDDPTCYGDFKVPADVPRYVGHEERSQIDRLIVERVMKE